LGGAVAAHRPRYVGNGRVPPGGAPRIIICGPAPFVEAAARDLRDLGHPWKLLKTDRFGRTGK
jgi:ferredoxin-NADP reductase